MRTVHTFQFGEFILEVKLGRNSWRGSWKGMVTVPGVSYPLNVHVKQVKGDLAQGKYTISEFA